MDHAGHSHPVDILFHPYLVHFPVAFFFLEALLIALWHRNRDDRYERFAFFILKLALLTVPFVMLAGFIDSGGMNPRVRLHVISASTLFLLNCLQLVWWIQNGPEFWQGPKRRLAFSLLWASVILTAITGHLGGRIAYG